MFSANYLNQVQQDAKNKGSHECAGVCECKGKYYKAEADKYVDMVIIPYRAGANNPMVLTRKIAQGEWVFSLDLMVHHSLGIDKKDYICPKTWNKPCPICDLQYKIYLEQGKEAAKSLRAKKRSWFNIALCDQQGSRYGELLVFNPSYVLFTEKLYEASLAETRGVSVTMFADIDTGNVISFHTIQEVLGKNKFVDYSSFKFGQRLAPIPQEFVKNAICFEDYLRMPDINELTDLAGNGAQWQTQPQEPSPVQQTQAMPSYSQPAVQPVTVPQQIQQSFNQQPFSLPVQQPSVNVQQQVQSPAVVQVAEIICPSGLRFGADCDSQRACRFCEVWDACDKAYKQVSYAKTGT